MCIMDCSLSHCYSLIESVIIVMRIARLDMPRFDQQILSLYLSNEFLLLSENRFALYDSTEKETT